MIKIDENECDIEGNLITVCTEIAIFFRQLNKMLDGAGVVTATMEEMIVCDEDIFQNMQKLMVRLDNAHTRAVATKKDGNLKF